MLRTLVLKIGPNFIQKCMMKHEFGGSAAIPISHCPTDPPVYDVMDKITYVVFKLREVRGLVSQCTMDGHDARKHS